MRFPDSKDFKLRPVLLALALLAATAAHADPLDPSVVDPAPGAPAFTETLLRPGISTEGFGTAVALYGNTAAVASLDSVMVFARQDARTWTRQATIRVGSGPRLISVAVWEHTLAIGDPLFDTVLIYERQGASWQRKARLRPLAGRDRRFGEAVALRGDLLAVGAPTLCCRIREPESVFLYARRDGAWHREARFFIEGGTDGAGFGSAVALGPRWLVAGAPFLERTYVFARQPEGTWVQETTLEGDSIPGNDNLFGYSVAAAASSFVVGAPGEDEVAREAGAAYVYERRNGTWERRAKLLPPGTRSIQAFGRSVGIAGPYVEAGVPLDDHDLDEGRDAGAVELFRFDAGTREYLPLARIEDSDEPDLRLGEATALSGRRLLIGNPGENEALVVEWKPEG